MGHCSAVYEEGIILGVNWHPFPKEFVLCTDSTIDSKPDYDAVIVLNAMIQCKHSDTENRCHPTHRRALIVGIQTAHYLVALNVSKVGGGSRRG